VKWLTRKLKNCIVESNFGKGDFMEILYKKYSGEYLDSIMDLEKSWITENITYGVVESGKEYFNNADKDYFYIALHQDKVIAYIISEIIEKNEYNIFPKDIKFLRVNDIYVLSEYRKQGIGEELIQITEKEAINNGIKHIFLSTATKDTDSVVKFYKKNGYKIWTTSLFKNIE
jgi:ribosomal protein S18 acetylase RimI-like enzyme